MTTATAPTTTSNVEKALSLARLGIPVFRVRLTEDGAKEPWGHKNGHLDATLDPNFIEDWFRDRPQALVGAHVGPASLIALDVDQKAGKDGWDSLDKSWLEIPETHGYDTPSGGRHLIYTAPEGLNLAPSTNYRGMEGVDTRAGSSWVLWNGDVPTSRDAFTPAPEWLLDEKTVKSADEFQGDVKDWYDTLEPGEPNALVRRAIERMNPDMGHADMVAATFEAIRLGAEGNPGVPDLLAALEDAWLSRDPGNHSTPEDRWSWKFQESLASGIQKYGDSISLRKDLPPYELSVVPSSVPSHLVAGSSGDKETFRALLAALLDATDDDMLVTSILWNSPRTKDLSRDWGLEFVHKRVTEARIKPEPKRENPTLVERAPEPEPEEASDSHEFLTPSEVERVKGIRTFVDDYAEASATKGFSTTTYAIPAAWTCLSMAFGGKVFIATGDTFGVNIWFQTLGYSGTGKTTEGKFLTAVLDTLLREEDEEAGYNLGAISSTQGMQETLLRRDGKPSIVHHDESADLFKGMAGGSEWMGAILDSWSRWYSGHVNASSNIRLKELRGKSAETSFNVHMFGTPDRLLALLDGSMFESGHMARMNWIWGAEPENHDSMYDMGIVEGRKSKVPEAAIDLATDLKVAAKWINPDEPVMMSAGRGVASRLSKAYKQMDKRAKRHERYDTIVQPAITRLCRETIWKCAALLALSRGSSRIELDDVLPAVYYAEDWFWTLLRVAGEVAESPYSRDAEAMERYVREEGGKVSRAKILNQFRGKIVKSQRELDDRLDFLLQSGRLNRVEMPAGQVGYELNGG